VPRALDRYQFQVVHDPTRNGTDFDVASMLKGEGERLAAALRAAAEAFAEGVVQVVRELLDIEIGDRDGFVWSLVQLLIPVFQRLDAAIDADRIYGQVRSSILGQIDASAVGDNRANLLDAPNFNTARAVDGGGIWLHDPDRGYTAWGAVTVTARGGPESLTSNMAQVSEAQTVRATVRMNTDAAVGDVVLAAVLLTDDEVVDVPEVDRYTVGQVRDTTTGVDGLEYLLMGGALPVPAGVNQVRLQLQIADTIPAGARVTFDQAFMGKQGGVLKRHVPDLTDIFDVLGGRDGALIGDVIDWHGIVPLVDRISRELPTLNIPRLDEVKVPRLVDLVDLFANGAGGGGDVTQSPIEDFQNWSRQVFDGMRSAQISATEALAGLRGLQKQGIASGVSFGAFPDGPVPAGVFARTTYFGAGAPAVRNGIVEWQRSGFLSAESNYLYVPEVLAFDPFEVIITMPRRSDLGLDSYLLLIGRASDDGYDRVVMFCGVDIVRVGVYVNNTGPTWLGPAVPAHVDPGSSLRLQGGITGPRIFQCSVNMDVVATYPDSGNLSPMDATHRRTGWGMHVGAGVTSQVRPGGIGSFTQNDVVAGAAGMWNADYRVAP
jgi:hypothetical protein